MIHSKIAVAALAALFSAGCKTRSEEFRLKGVTGEQLSATKRIDYGQLLGQVAAGRPLRYIMVMGYDKSHTYAPGQSASNDGSTQAVYDIIEHLTTNRASGDFDAPAVEVPDSFSQQAGAALQEELEPESGNQMAARGTGTIQRLPAGRKGNDGRGGSGWQAPVVYGQTYGWAAEARGVRVMMPGESAARTIDIRFEIYIGSSVVPGGWGGYSMPEEFKNILAKAFVEGDVASYNGHIWSSDPPPPSPWIQVPPDDNTEKLVAAIDSLGGRNKYGLLYVNACHAERIEKELMRALYREGAGATQPLLVSHRNYSNFGFFAQHNGVIVRDLLRGRQLPRLMLDLTTTYWARRTGAGQQPMNGSFFPGGFNNGRGQKIVVPPGDDITDDMAAQELARYHDSGVREDPESVIVVAYDVEAEARLGQQGTSAQ